MSAWAVVQIVLMGATFCLLLAGTVLLVAARRRSRATLFTDITLKVVLLAGALFYLGYMADHAEDLGGDPDFFLAMETGAHFLIAAFFLVLGISLLRYARSVDGPVLVTPEFLVGMRDRLSKMYGPGPTRFLSYAVGKESAQQAMEKLLAARVVRSSTLWKRLPTFFSHAGYGRMKYLRQDPGQEMKVQVSGTFEASHATAHARGGCDLTRGYLAGIGNAAVPQMECEVEETRCGRAHGEDACEFTLRWFERTPLEPVPVAARVKGV